MRTVHTCVLVNSYSDIQYRTVQYTRSFSILKYLIYATSNFGGIRSFVIFVLPPFRKPEPSTRTLTRTDGEFLCEYIKYRGGLWTWTLDTLHTLCTRTPGNRVHGSVHKST